jgi:anti-sigma B factor antagonist
MDIVSQSLIVRETVADGVILVEAIGELDVATAPDLDHRLAELAARGHARIVLDLGELRFCDAHGISVFVRARTRARTAQGWFRLMAAGDQMRKILQIVRLAAAFPVYDSLEAATGDGLPLPG